MLQKQCPFTGQKRPDEFNYPLPALPVDVDQDSPFPRLFPTLILNTQLEPATCAQKKKPRNYEGKTSDGVGAMHNGDLEEKIDHHSAEISSGSVANNGAKDLSHSIFILWNLLTNSALMAEEDGGSSFFGGGVTPRGR